MIYGRNIIGLGTEDDTAKGIEDIDVLKIKVLGSYVVSSRATTGPVRITTKDFARTT